MDWTSVFAGMVLAALLFACGVFAGLLLAAFLIMEDHRDDTPLGP